jgi:hypothetical protein
MTPTKTECSAETYQFGQLDRRQVVADFSGGTITSDGGLILVAQIDQHYRISERVAECFADQRQQERVQHELADLVGFQNGGAIFHFCQTSQLFLLVVLGDRPILPAGIGLLCNC